MNWLFCQCHNILASHSQVSSLFLNLNFDNLFYTLSIIFEIKNVTELFTCGSRAGPVKLINCRTACLGVGPRKINKSKAALSTIK